MTATDAKVDAVDVAEGPDGTIFMADDRGGRVLAIDATGHLHLVAGTGRAASGGDGGPATEASLRHPTAVAVTRDGELLVAEAQGARVRLIRSDGTISTVAGTGTPGSSRDGVPATAAQLEQPSDVVALDDGAFVIADERANQLRRVDADGRISTLVATDSPHALAVMPDGGLLIAEGAAGRVRRMNAQGVITTVVGGGTKDPDEGLPAVKARVNYIGGIAALADGSFLFQYDDIWRVTPDGILRRFLPFPDFDFAGRGQGSGRLSATADGDVFRANGLLRWIAAAKDSSRLATAVTDISARADSLRVTFTATVAASATLTVLRRNRPLADVTAPSAGPGTATLSLDRAFAPGRYTIRLSAQTTDGRVATDSLTASLGAKLTRRDVRIQLQSVAINSVDESENHVGICHSFGPRRTDCEIRLQDGSQPDHCVAVLSVALPSSGIPSLAQYRCRRSRSTPRFRVHPHFLGHPAPFSEANLSFP